MGELLNFSGSSPDEPVNGFLDLIELMIMRRLIDHLDDHQFDEAHDLAVIREAYLDRYGLGEPSTTADADAYLAILVHALRKLTPIIRAHIRHPACSREHAQHLLRGEA